MDVLLLLCRDEVEGSQLVCRQWRDVVDTHGQRLPLRLFVSVRLVRKSFL